LSLTVTVAICTRNRAELLASTLHRIADCVVPPGMHLDVLVVDNGSTDATPAVLEVARRRLPLRWTAEPRPGASYARNRALAEATGDVILWTDDDVLVSDGWLAAYSEAFARWPDAAFFGGPIEPLFVGRAPMWLTAASQLLDGPLARRELGPHPRQFNPAVLPYGANLAMRRAAQVQFGYDVRLGPAPDRAFGGEETDLMRRMLEAGMQGWWVPEARVQHVIPKSRQTTRYIRRYYESYGTTLVSDRTHRDVASRAGSKVLRRPLWVWRDAIAAEARYRASRLSAPPEVWVRHLVSASVVWGQWQALGRRPLGQDR
jgi:glycosyltransferase involved in cell wall biosynthesis